MITLYKDEKFELNVDVEDIDGMELKIKGKPYILTSHYYEPCTYIESKDKRIKIIMHNAFDLSIVRKDFESNKNTSSWSYGNVSPEQFCELIEREIRQKEAERRLTIK